MLDVPVEAVREPAKAAQLGAPLSWAQDLYTDLQQYYYQWIENLTVFLPRLQHI